MRLLLQDLWVIYILFLYSIYFEGPCLEPKIEILSQTNQAGVRHAQHLSVFLFRFVLFSALAHRHSHKQEAEAETDRERAGKWPAAVARRSFR